MRFALVLPFLALPAYADVERAIADHILAGHEALARATDDPASEDAADCTPEAVRPGFHAAYDAWVITSLARSRIVP